MKQLHRRNGIVAAALALLLSGGAGCASTQHARVGSVEAQQDGTRIVSVPENATRPDPSRGPNLERVEKLIVEKTNEFRQDQGLEPVKVNEELQAAAEAFARYMARTNRYGHAADGRQPAERAEAHGYEPCLVSENIAYQFSSAGFEAEELADEFVQGWIDSPGHRKNMVDPDAVQTGAAVAQSEDGTYYAVQMFGRPESMRVDFKISNESGKTVTYRLDNEQFELPPRMIRTHGACRRPELTFQPGGSADVKTFRPDDGAEYIVRAAQEGVRIDPQ